MKLQTARGVSDIAPQDKILMNKVVSILQESFRLSGFAPLETPIIERLETLSAKFTAGESSDALKEIFQLSDQGKRELALRFDLTVPLARYVAMNPNLKMPFKRYEMGPVFRDGPIKKGRTRQFWQCDADIVGSSSILCETELLSIFQLAFAKLKIPITIKVNNRKLLVGILKQVGIDNVEEAIISVDKFDKIGKEGVTKELVEKGLSESKINKLFEYVSSQISLKELKEKVTNELAQEGIEELKELFSYLEKMNVKDAIFDVSLARGLAYYTGTVYEVFSPGSVINSSLAGGGRFDDMIGNFMGGGRIVPAVGISFGIVPIMEVLKKQKVKQKTTTQVYVIPINIDCFSLVQSLRQAGIASEFSLGKKGVSKNLEYAAALKIPYCIIVGEDEVKQGKVILRDMRSGEERLLKIESVLRILQNG